MKIFIRSLNNSRKNFEFLVTTVTLSSAKLAEEEFKDQSNFKHRFLPVDVRFLMKKFFLQWKPNAIFLIDSEIWPNLILTAEENKIPIGLINGRITSKSYKRWLIIHNTAKKIFSKFKLCLCSNFETQNYLSSLGVKNVQYCGNIKLIQKIIENNISEPNENFLKKNKAWLAASTHNGEEMFCLKTHLILKEKFNNLITIIAPRHINRCKKIKNLCKKFNLNSQIISKGEKILAGNEIIIINSFGNLQNYFKSVRSVFIGKSIIKKLKNVSGQNPIDAARLGCKIYHGPYVYNFKEIYELLKKRNLSKEINNIDELSLNLKNDLENPINDVNQGAKFIDDLGKKTFIDTMKNIDNFLLNEIK